ncbi:PAS domain S-box protein [Endomicrobium sp. AH-315-J14]|nr:PAS domain S-box protein [Endomicrobium sp. AH-315-J14]
MYLTLTFAFTTLVAAGLAVKATRDCWRVETELEGSRQFIELAYDPVLVADIGNGRILQANPAAAELLGYTTEEILNLTLPELHPKDRVAESAEVIADVWEKKGLVYSIPFVRKDGEPVAVEISARVFTYRRKAAMLIYARDIRQRLRLESQLVQSEKMASLGQLVAGVAHEINTPIGSIHSNADIANGALRILEKALEKEGLAEAVAKNKKLQRAFKILKESNESNRIASERIVERVRSLKNFARLDESEQKMADLHEGLDNTLMLVRHELKRGVKIEKNYGELPEILCFPNQLNQVFMNILVNAIHAMDHKGTITITTRHEGEELQLSFQDTGSGIAPGDIDRIFDPGFTRKGVGVGTGLGLSISYQIIEKHHGRIAVDSELGVGTTFTLHLPLEPPDDR